MRERSWRGGGSAPPCLGRGRRTPSRDAGGAMMRLRHLRHLRRLRARGAAANAARDAAPWRPRASSAQPSTRRAMEASSFERATKHAPRRARVRAYARVAVSCGRRESPPAARKTWQCGGGGGLVGWRLFSCSGRALVEMKSRLPESSRAGPDGGHRTHRRTFLSARRFLVPPRALVTSGRRPGAGSPSKRGARRRGLANYAGESHESPGIHANQKNQQHHSHTPGQGTFFRNHFELISVHNFRAFTAARDFGRWLY